MGDEGVKAKYNLPDPNIANATPDGGSSDDSRDSRYRVLAAQRNGIERMTAFAGANYPLAATAPTDALYLGRAYAHRSGHSPGLVGGRCRRAQKTRP